MLVQRYSVLGEPRSPSEQAQHQARQLLLRYGILSRDLLKREAGALGWAALYPCLQRMEWRNEVRRGYFVRGLAGQQFALPEAVEALRQWRQAEAPGRGRLVLVNVTDPALVYSRLTAAEGAGGLERVDYIPSNYVVLQDGLPILAYEHGSARWYALEGEDVSLVQEAIRLCVDHVTGPGGIATRPRRVFVRSWNGLSPLEPTVQALLAPLGFRREALYLVWDGLQADG